MGGKGAGIALVVSGFDDDNITASIVAESTGTNGQGQLNFYTKQSTTSGVAPTQAMTIENDGTISVNTASYETLITNNNNLPNKKYVDDEISGLTDIDAGTTAGQLAFWDGSKWTYTESTELIWDDANKRVGIGTSTPVTPLEISAFFPNSLAKFGAIELISPITNQSFLAENAYFDGANFRYRAGGYASFMVMGENIEFSLSSSGSAGNSVSSTSTPLYIYNNADVAVGGSADISPVLFIDADGDILLENDNSKAIWGAGQDASIYYDGTDFNINPKEVGTGDLNILGRITHEGTFAEIHVHDNSTSQSIATGATYTKSTAFDSNGFSSNCTPDQANDKITITKAGIYRVEGAFSFSSGTANVEVFGSAFLNGVEQDQVHWTRQIATAGDVGNANFTGLIDVTTVPWDLDFRMRHDNGSAVDMTISYANLNVTYLGET